MFQYENKVNKLLSIFSQKLQLAMIGIQNYTILMACFRFSILKVKSLTIEYKLSKLHFFIIVGDSLLINIYYSLMPNFKYLSHLTARYFSISASTSFFHHKTAVTVSLVFEKGQFICLRIRFQILGQNSLK
jgi:hypothetical protein